MLIELIHEIYLLLSISIVTIRLQSSNPRDLENYYKNDPSMIAKHPVAVYQIYFLMSRDLAGFGLASCMIPALAFCGLIYLKGGARAMILAAVAFPFLMSWESLSQNISVISFMFAIAFKDRKPVAAGFFALGCLSHRMGIWLGLAVLVAYIIPFERIKAQVDNVKQLAMALLAALLIISLFYHCDLFATFSRGLVLMGIWLWSSFRSDDARMTALMILIVIGGLATQGQYDGNRVLFTLQPLTVLGMAMQGKVAGWQMLAYLLVMGIFLISFDLMENRTPNFTGAINGEVHGCSGVSVPDLVRIASEKAVGIINSKVKDISGGGDDA